jgi:hypothetical protein
MILKLINKYYFLFIFLVYSISYGQMLMMGIWKDDNAIFFKLQHIAEPAGFFGKGLIGEGPYRFSFTPYWFVYKIFGQHSLLPYYLLIYLFYFLAIISVYKFVSKFVSPNAGKVAGFLFACGFIASEGFFWLANAMVSDISIILVSFLLFFYWKYFQSRKIINYYFAVIIYWVTCYFVPIRSYYFIGIIFIFELIFLTFTNKLRSILNSFLRLVPFFTVFYWFFIKGGDARTGLLKDILNALSSGKLYISYGFLSSIANVIVSDNITAKFFDFENRITSLTHIGLSYVVIATFGVLILGFYILFRRDKHNKIITIVFGLILTLWYVLAKNIFNVPVLNLNNYSSYVVFLGGAIVVFLLSFYFLIKMEFKKKYIFLLLSLFITIAAYSSYEPLVVFNSTHRYLVGTFFVLVCLFSLFYFISNKKIKIVIIIWGVVNLINSFFYQHQILVTRTFPVNNFFGQLMTYVPKINKGDFLYFDLANNSARNNFSDAISTASMPDETSIAWRYRIDRYDFTIIRDFKDLVNIAEKGNISYDKLHTFFYSNNKLTDTTSDVRKSLWNDLKEETVGYSVVNKDNNLIIKFNNPVYSSTPVLLTMNLKGLVNIPDNISFPYIKDNNMAQNSVAVDTNLRTTAFKYLDSKKNIQNKAKIKTSSEWMADVTSQLNDGDIQTNWRSNRLLWSKENTYLIYDMSKTYSINRFVWINGFGNSTPTDYSIDVSLDGNNWKEIKEVKNNTRIDSKDPQTIEFDKQDARFIRLNIKATLDEDAPQIAEVWPVLTDYKDLPILEAESFLNNPLGYVPDLESFKITIRYLKNTGEVELYYLSDNDLNFQTSFDSKNNLIYDSKDHKLNFTIIPGGTKISQIMLKNVQIPGDLALDSITYKILDWKELLSK